MEFQVSIYGVSNGFDYWSRIEDDYSYYSSFYSDVVHKRNEMQIEIRNVRGKKYSYYNYLIYENVLNKEGRSDSFFGLTLRFDAYCLDVQNVYRILDITFKRKLLNEIVKKDGGAYQFLVDDLKSVENYMMSDVEPFVAEKITSILSQQDDFVPIGDDFLMQQSKSCINLIDAKNQDSVLSSVKSGVLIVSEYCNSWLSQSRENELNDTIKTLNDTIKTIEEEMGKQKKKIGFLEKQKTNNQEKIREAIKSLRDILDSPEGGNFDKRREESNVPIIEVEKKQNETLLFLQRFHLHVIVLLLICLILLALLVFNNHVGDMKGNVTTEQDTIIKVDSLSHDMQDTINENNHDTNQ